MNVASELFEHSLASEQILALDTPIIEPVAAGADPADAIVAAAAEAGRSLAADDPRGALAAIGVSRLLIATADAVDATADVVDATGEVAVGGGAVVAPPVRWYLSTTEAIAHAQLGDDELAHRGHEVALADALADGFEEGVARSRLHLARALARAGETAAALDLLTRVVDDESGGREFMSLATVELGALLCELRAPALAVDFLDRSLEQLPPGRDRTRLRLLQLLVEAAVGCDRIGTAASALAALEELIPESLPGRDSMLAPERAAVAMAQGLPDRTLAILTASEHDGSEIVTPASPAVRALWWRALNMLERHQEVIELAERAGTDELGDDMVLELAHAHEATGDHQQTYLLERRAFEIRAGRNLGMTALLPVVDELTVSGVMADASRELEERVALQERAYRHLRSLTEGLVGDLTTRVDGLHAAVHRLSGELAVTDRTDLTTRANDVLAVVDALDQRLAVTTDGEIRTEHVLQRLCRGVAPISAQRGITIEGVVTPGGSEPGGWQHYSTWRDQLLGAVRQAPDGSTVTATADGAALTVTVG